MDLTKKLSFSSTFLKVYLVLGKIYLPSFSKFITGTTERQNGNIWKDQYCLAEVVYIYAWQQHAYQWPDSFRKNFRIWHLKVSFFQQFGYFPLFIIFLSLNYADVPKDPIIWKIIQFEKISKPPEDSSYMGSTV